MFVSLPPILQKSLLALLAGWGALLTAGAQSVGGVPSAANVPSATNTYHILHQTDTALKVKLEGVSLGSRSVRHYVYEYPSVDPDGQPVTISGVILAPTDIVSGDVPCDGIILFNHHTLGNPSQAPSHGELEMPSVMLANPLKPNYIIVMSDYIGYGSSIDRPAAYLCGDTNARNILDGLLAARQLFSDHHIAQGKYLFNMGYSQGATESMYAAKLCDMEPKYQGIVIDKTFVGGGLLDTKGALAEYVRRDECDAINDVAMFLIANNEWRHMGIKYSDLFKEPVASNVEKAIRTKNKGDLGIYGLDSLHQLLQPAYMNPSSAPAKALDAKLGEIAITNGWKPNLNRQYFIEHSRHDNYVPVQCARPMISWMKQQGFKPSIVPGESSLQTNMLVFKLNHQQSAIVWAVQTMAAIQFWPVLYYEGEQNRFYREVVHVLNLMKLIKYLESWGIDLRKIVRQGNSRAFVRDVNEAIAKGTLEAGGSVRQLSGMRRASFFDILGQITGVLKKLGLTLTDFYEMLEDSGIKLLDIVDVIVYLTNSPDASRSLAETSTLPTELVSPEAMLFLPRLYEQTLVDWLHAAGVNVEYVQ